MGANDRVLQLRSLYGAVFSVSKLEAGRRVSAAALSPAVSRGSFE